MLQPASTVHLLRSTPSSLRNRIEPQRRTQGCADCPVRGVCVTRNVAAHDIHLLERLAKAARHVRRGAVLCHASEPFTGLFAVRTGSFKSVRVSQAGEWKVTGFHLRGDILGTESLGGTHYHHSVVALEDSEVCSIHYESLVHCASWVPGLQSGLFQVLSADITRDQGLMLLLGPMSAERRMIAFVLGMSRRKARMHDSADRLVLQMTRADIGSYLGLSVETVSRVFTRLAHDGLIAVDGREVALVDLEALKARFDAE